MDRKHFGIGGALLGFGIVIICIILWQPERQVRKHQELLLSTMEKRQWGRFAGLIAENYSDRWHHDKTFLRVMPREVFGQFEHLAIAQLDSGIQLQNENKTGIATARIKISGAGGPFAEIAREKINGVNAPFVFRWEKQGWIPWSWHLVNVENPELEIPAP